MRPALAVDVNAANDGHYELEVSPRSDSLYTNSINDSKHSIHLTQPSIHSNVVHESTPAIPSIRLLFHFISRRHFFVLVVPAICSSLIAGGIAPFMTFVVGQAFDVFAAFPLTPNPPASAKDALLRGVGLAAVELVGLAVGSLALGSVTSALWIWTGETNVMALRKAVYAAVTRKDMVWFDSNMGSTEGASEQEHNSVGAGGLMAKFTRETDDVRMATSLASGTLLQYLTTCVTCLVLAFVRSWALTLVILSAVPVLIFIQGLSQRLAGPLLNQERNGSSVAATLVDRAVAAISTVKAFNAAPHEHSRAMAVFTSLLSNVKRLYLCWGFTAALSQFVMMAMFVQGFWFGAKLVRDGTVSPGDVMAVFWACLIATSNLQMCIPQFIILTKGKFAMASLVTLIGDTLPPAPNSSSDFATFPQSKNRVLRKIVPTRCTGQLALHNVTFAYPSRPTVPVLSDVSLFLPANEMTFIVGASGSGKSTVAQLLMRLYEPQQGSVNLDDQDVRYLDEDWMRTHIAGVSQQGGNGIVILDGRNVHDNISACFVNEERKATREEVVEASRAALMHEFVRDLPDGYETILGGGSGVGLSGGQKQRLAIARAKLRNPTVLILDEATSALDATSRLLVFEALKHWRRNKTTIVITHDLSQISPSDFVYVLKQGVVVEQGYRYDLESPPENSYFPDVGEFRKMMQSQQETGGFLPARDLDQRNDMTELVEENEVEESVGLFNPPSLRPLTLGNWMFEAVAELTAPRNAAPAPVAPAVIAERHPYEVSRFDPFNTVHEEEGHVFTELPYRARRPSSVHSPTTPVTLSTPAPAYTISSRRFSLQFIPTTPTATNFDDKEMERKVAALRRVRAKPSRTRWDSEKVSPLTSVQIDSGKLDSQANKPDDDGPDNTRPQFWQLMRSVWPTVPHKPFLFLGLFVCLCSGAVTPIFSYLLAQLLYQVAIGAQNVAFINHFGAIVLAFAALDGILIGLKYFIMEVCGMAWVTHVRGIAFNKILSQDKKWFDKAQNSPSRLVQILVKDGDDARNLIAVVWGQSLVVIAMLGVGLVWALVKGWQLTLVGFAIAPAFAVTMAVQTRLVAKCELRNKRAREEVAKGYYEAISNIRGIRAMSLESIFASQFETATDAALHAGVRGALVEGCTYGVASGLIYLAEALLFFVGAVLISRGTYTYLQMVEVLNLVVFTVTIGSQLMAFTERIAKSVQATSDFDRLMKLDKNTDEARGVLTPELSGTIAFRNVDFSYPTRREATVLKGLNLKIADGECVAIVGPSGSGKSTIASLLQRLYEPDSGCISIGSNILSALDTHHLRDQVSVVSQHPNLFDASIAENIRYGNASISAVDIRRAAKAANAHEFIMGLPQGYDTLVGENASLLSGGQAQRLQIARALARGGRVLVLDECTSALDPENQAMVLDSIRKAKVGRTTVMVTHKMQVMRMCDRIVVVSGGEVVEQGTYEELMARRGVFATLSRGGEWASE